MRWSEEFATGIASIDEQHRMIFRMTGDFRIALDEGEGEQVYDDLLRSLDLYIRTHFRIEEECMARFQCAAAEQNKVAHARFAKILANLRERYAVSGFKRSDARELIDLLEQWLANHICRIDVQLKGARIP